LPLKNRKEEGSKINNKQINGGLKVQYVSLFSDHGKPDQTMTAMLGQVHHTNPPPNFPLIGT
jgi:hypothetical protein